MPMMRSWRNLRSKDLAMPLSAAQASKATTVELLAFVSDFCPASQLPPIAKTTKEDEKDADSSSSTASTKGFSSASRTRCTRG